MCGIAGLYAPALEADRLPDVVRRMAGALHHRGPDDRGYYETDGFAMGMTRLSIIDVAGGHQPIASEDGRVVVVCNGEIYNYQQLRRELEAAGHRFRTGSDVEVIVHLYEDLGLRCFEKLRGMFGAAIWDASRRRLVIARDRLGIKPLYYAASPNQLLFGSELKAVIRSGLFAPHLDHAAVDRFFTFGYIPAPWSIFREVRKLKPGHLLVFEEGRATMQPYWGLQFTPDTTLDETQVEERVTELLRDAVKSHLMSEVPLGAFLSGGVDSGLVVALMSEAASMPVRTFTIGFSGSIGGFVDERPYARMVSEKYGTIHTEFQVEPKLDEILDKIIDSFDEPFADDSVIPTYYICQLAKRDVTVALTGLGGDELFGGYERYLGYKLSLGYERVPAVIRQRVIEPLVNRLPERHDGHYTVNHLKRFVRSASLPRGARYLEYLSVMSGSLKSRLYSDELVRAAALESNGDGDGFDSQFHEAPASSWLNRAFHYDMQTYLPEDVLALTDRLSMCHALELRVPFLDHPLVEFCATIPENLKVRGTTKKYVLRRVASRFLPDPVLNHRKQGFASPMAAWLKGDLSGYIRDSLSERRLGTHGFFRQHAVDALIKAHMNREELYDRQIVSLLMFQKWHERYM